MRSQLQELAKSSRGLCARTLIASGSVSEWAKKETKRKVRKAETRNPVVTVLKKSTTASVPTRRIAGRSCLTSQLRSKRKQEVGSKMPDLRILRAN